MDRRGTARMLIAPVAYLGAITMSAIAGTPAQLPDVALGWSLLLHLQRGAVLLATVGVVILVGSRAARGELPIRFGQIEYEARQAAAEVERAVMYQEDRLLALEDLVKPDRAGRNPVSP